MARLRILFFINSLERGGAEQSITDLIKGVSPTHEVMVWTLYPTAPHTLAKRALPVPVHLMHLNGTLCSLRNLRKIFAAWKAIKAWKPHILHARLFDANACAYLLSRFLPGTKLITAAGGGHYWYKRRHRIMARLFYGASSVILVNSKTLKDEIKALLGEPARVEVVANGIDVQKFQQPSAEVSLPWSNEKIVVGSVGRFAREKCYGDILAVARQLLAEDDRFCFLWVGGQGEFEQIREKVQSLHLEEHIFMTGEVDDVIPYLKRMTLFFMASSSEGMPNALLEAMACGKPVLATAVGNIPELIQPGIHGILVAPHDIPAMVAGLKTLADDVSLRVKCALNNQLRATDYSLEAMVERTTEIYESVSRE